MNILKEEEFSPHRSPTNSVLGVVSHSLSHLCWGALASFWNERATLDVGLGEKAKKDTLLLTH